MNNFSKSLSLVFVTLFAHNCLAADTYDAANNVLNIPLVKVGDSLYQDVKVTVGTVVSIGTGPSADTFDTYNASNGQLSIPVVNVGGTPYYDVVITLSKISSVGPSCVIDSTCTKVGTPEVKGVLPGDGRVSVMFNFMGGKITGLLSNTKFVQASTYTAICTSTNGGLTGSSQTSVEYASGLANLTNPLVVSGLSNGKSYTCSVTAAASGAYPATSKSSSVTTPNLGSMNSAGVLSGTLNTAHTQAYPSYASYCNYINQSATGLPVPPSVSFYSTSGTLTSGTSESTVICTSSERTISGNAIPDHKSSEFFTSGLTGYTSSPYFSGNPNSIGAKAVSKTVPLTGTLSSLYTKGANGFDTEACYNYTSSTEPSKDANTKWTSGGKVWSSGALRCTWVAYFAYMNNSVKVEVGTAETYTSSGNTYNVSGKNIYQDVGLDPSNAHNQPTMSPGSSQKFYGYYHVHGMPEGHIARLGKGNSTMTLIGFAVDGFPIYARYGYTNSSSASGGVTVMKSNYRLRTSAELSAAGYGNRPSASTAPYGSFEQDWVFDATSTSSSKGHLDACNGRYGVTPESPTTSVYHYFITDSYPFVPRCVFGSPASWGNDGAAN
jgi:YHYH protein